MSGNEAINVQEATAEELELTLKYNWNISTLKMVTNTPAFRAFP